MIHDDLWEGRIVPFLGAGASLVGQSKDADGQTGQSRLPPSGRELAQLLAKYASYPKDEPTENLAKVASYFQLQGGRTRLRKKLAEVFDHEFETGVVHELLAEIPAPMLIVTTNYDTLIERAFEARSKRYHVVQWTDNAEYAGSVLWWEPGAADPTPYPPKSLPLEPGSETVIYKMHGGIVPSSPRWNSFLITEEDYIDFLSRMTQQAAIPATFKAYLQDSSFLFLGYALTDWNLRVLLHNVKSVQVSAEEDSADRRTEVVADVEDLRSWAIQFHPSELELELWKLRHVDIYDVDLNNFIRELRACLEPDAR